MTLLLLSDSVLCFASCPADLGPLDVKLALLDALVQAVVRKLSEQLQLLAHSPSVGHAAEADAVRAEPSGGGGDASAAPLDPSVSCAVFRHIVGEMVLFHQALLSVHSFPESRPGLQQIRDCSLGPFIPF